jgi:hypothetical protein
MTMRDLDILIFKKKHGPKLELLYHYGEYNGEVKSNIAKNSIIFRLSYNISRLFYQ